ncbi:hypothetical protein GCK72_009299 [Caenorhabditis remanei]|uniref:Uncharacterized protein n=1 Tax=Caenorhabditis remanei TaxID=31234 RepID=A0A6A5H275_CAERE|nr:hypothetical protein GCK72_009299 [Caenorhabditis remanei]KAF1761045.1 hypothetical protein GCK72_009299 [Caenorhabditis remanei]
MFFEFNMKSVNWSPDLVVVWGEGEGEEEEVGEEESEEGESGEEGEEKGEEGKEGKEGKKEEGEGKRREEKKQNEKSDLNAMVEYAFEQVRVPTALGDLFSMSYRGGVFRPIYEETVNSLNKMPIDKLFDEDVSGIPLLAVPNDDNTRYVILEGVHRFASLLSRSLTEEEKNIEIKLDVIYVGERNFEGLLRYR